MACTRQPGLTQYCTEAADAHRRIAELEAALAAIFLAADSARTEQEWADKVSSEMTDERRALIQSR